MDGDWITIEKKVKKPSSFKPCLKSRDEILLILSDFFNNYNYFSSVVLYGSIVSCISFRETSDIDIMIFNQSLIHPGELRELKKRIVELTGRKVDLVFMKITKKYQDPIFHDRVFFEQVREEGKTLFGSEFKDFIDRSVKILKV